MIFTNKISLGILSYQRTDLLIETIYCLNKVSTSIDLIILNNNEDFCIKNDIESVISNQINLIYICHGKNYGVSHGRDVILNSCDTEFLILLDDDIYIENINQVIEETFKGFQDPSVYGLAYNIVEYGSKYHNRFEIPHKNKLFDMKNDQYTYLMIGAGHALRVRESIESGGYAKDFGLYGFEEVDLAFRLINQGGKIKYSSKCLVEHKKSPDGRFSNNYVNYQGFVNRTRMAKRSFKTRYYISCMIVRSLFLLYRTRSIKTTFKAIREVLNDVDDNKFNPYFYNYVRSVKGFLWY